MKKESSVKVRPGLRKFNSICMPQDSRRYSQPETSQVSPLSLMHRKEERWVHWSP